MRIDLQVPYAEKDIAKSMGARWDMGRCIWYLENPDDLIPFIRWMPGVKHPSQWGKKDTTAKGASKKSNPKIEALGDTVTLAEYMKVRFRNGKVKAITRKAADAFGIPFPPPSGWFEKYAGLAVTKETVRRLVIAAQKTKKARAAKRMA